MPRPQLIGQWPVRDQQQPPVLHRLHCGIEELDGRAVGPKATGQCSIALGLLGWGGVPFADPSATPNRGNQPAREDAKQM